MEMMMNCLICGIPVGISVLMFRVNMSRLRIPLPGVEVFEHNRALKPWIRMITLCKDLYSGGFETSCASS